MAMAEMRDDELELFFEAGRAAAPAPSAALLERVLADAQAHQSPRAPGRTPPAAAGRRAWAGLLAALGGWPAVAGLASVMVAGIWLGYAAPDGLDGLSAALWPARDGYDVVDMVPSFDGLLGEG
jgi:hypothetical protein